MLMRPRIIISTDAYLIKYRLVGADEAPLDHLLLTIRIQDRITDVEQLTVIGHISIVAIHSSITTEFINNVLSDAISIRNQAQRITFFSILSLK